MKHKTNLFYTTGPDSKFLTFSNYAESLTGSFLSTNNKLFPTAFLALNIPDLDSDEKKQNFISQYLCGYYENKLAVLREYAIDNNMNAESFLCPLNILLECIEKWSKKDESTDDFSIVYVGDVTEQDYNGVYADTICTLDLNNAKKGEIEYNDNIDIELNAIEVDETYLHGWNRSELDNISESNPFSVYKTLNPIYDKTSSVNYYYTKSNIERINLLQSTDTEITFNAIILLYDMIDITSNNEYTSTIVENNIIDLILDESSNILANRNCPFGFWIADKSITINIDNRTNTAPTWSLSVLSQFRPTPYNLLKRQDPSQINNINTFVDLSTAEKQQAYVTFAQILARQNIIISKYEEVLNSIQITNDDLREKINTLTSQLNTNVTELTDSNTALQNRINLLVKELNSLKETLKNKNII